MSELPICQQCGQQHVGRGGYIGSGDCGAILGVSEYRSAVDVYQSKIAPSEESFAPTAVMERGIILEPVILDAFEKARGVRVIDRQMFRGIPGLAFPIASHIDGRVEGTGALVEAKSAAFGLRDQWGAPGSAEIPENYLCQAVHHLACNPEADGIWQPVMFVGFTIQLVEFYVPRDAQFVKDVIDAEVAFAEKHIIQRLPPPAVTSEDVKRLYPKALGTSVEATTEVALAVNDLRSLRQRIKALQDEDDLIEGKVAAALGQHERLTFAGKDIATFKTQKRASYVVKDAEFRVLRLKK